MCLGHQSVHILAKLKAIAVCLLVSSLTTPSHASQVETIETITFKDGSGVEHEELAFRAPMSGVPEHILRMYCANVKLRLYWNVYRDEVKNVKRKGIFLRRMARFAKHIYHDIRSVDRPFNATRLSVIDDYFAVKDPLDDNATSGGETEDEAEPQLGRSSSKSKKNIVSASFNKVSAKVFKQDKQHGEDELDGSSSSSSDPQLEIIEHANGELLDSTSMSRKDTMKQFKTFLKRYSAKVGMGIYTRWRTMWWLMMPCLFAKYYLWDPALDEFTKLQRNLVMYPDFLSMKLQNIECRPVKLFQRILDVCKILNPLMKIDLGQFSLDKMTRFKSDT